MITTYPTPKLILLLPIFAALIACTGVSQQPNNNSTPQKNTLGKIVSQLDSSIWTIYQDAKNHYWFGSNGKGLYYFDGTILTHYNTEDGLVANQITGIQEDSTGNLYIETQQGISKFDGQGFSTLKAVDSPKNEWKSAANDLWFKGDFNSNSVYRYDGKVLYQLSFPEKDLEKAYGIKFENINFSPYGVYSIYKDKKENIWFGTLSAGVFRFDGDSLYWIAEKELTTLEDGRVPAVRSIIEDKDGNFWLSNILHRYRVKRAGKGLFEYEKLEGIGAINGQFFPELAYFMSAVIDPNNADLWLLSYNAGVWRYDGEKLTQYLIKDGKTDVLLFSMYKDKQGIIWLGTHNAGVYRFNGLTFERFKLI